MTQQRRRVSLLETCLSTVIGFGVGLLANILVLPLFGLHPTLADSSWISVVYTIISIVRGFGVRRLFVWMHNEGILR